MKLFFLDLFMLFACILSITRYIHIKPRIALAIIFIVTSTFSSLAQSSISFEKKELAITRSPEYDKKIYIKIEASNIPPKTKTCINVITASNDNTAAYVLDNSEINLEESITEVQVPFIIKMGKPSADADTVELIFFDSLANKTRKLLLIITAESEADSPAASPLSNKITFLNAYNFDFGDTKLNSNYVGRLDFFSLSIGKTKFGFNTGIMKVDYGLLGDSLSNERLMLDSVKISPFDNLVDKSKYLRQQNSYKTVTKNTVWSFYVQPIYELTRKKSSQHIYVHAHLELLSIKYSTTTTITTIKQDTAIYSSSNPPSVIRSGLSNSSTYTLNAFSGYFGAGFTFDLNPWQSGRFFFQPTIGYASNSLELSQINRQQYSLQNDWISFYLVRAYYSQELGKNSSVVIGMDIRGILPKYAPQYAAYIGLNIGLDAIIKILK